MVSPEGSTREERLCLQAHSGGCRQALVSHMSSPQGCPPASPVTSPRVSGPRERATAPKREAAVFFHNLVSEVTSRHLCSILFPRRKSVSPAHTEREQMYKGVNTPRGRITGGYLRGYPALHLYRQRKVLEDCTRNI